MKAMTMAMDRVLEKSVSQHGFWLVNNVEAVRSYLEGNIVKYGDKKVSEWLNDIDSEFVKNLYKKIELARA